MSQREQFVVVVADDRRPDVAARCATVLDALRGVTQVARVDAYSDFAEQMPADIREAEAWLRARGLADAGGDPGLAIAVEPADEVGWTIVRAYAPWATRVALFDADDVNVATLQHGGQFITVNLTSELVTAVTLALAPGASLSPLATDDPATGDLV